MDENPYGMTPLSVHCGYCSAPAGQPCTVKDSEERASQTHDFRYAQQISAKKAWTQGRREGRNEVADKLQLIIDESRERLATITQVG